MHTQAMLIVDRRRASRGVAAAARSFWQNDHEHTEDQRWGFGRVRHPHVKGKAATDDHHFRTTTTNTCLRLFSVSDTYICYVPARSSHVLSNSGSHTQTTPTNQMSKHSSQLSSPPLLSICRRLPDVSLVPEEVPYLQRRHHTLSSTALRHRRAGGGSEPTQGR